MSISPPSSPEGSMEMPPYYVQIPTSSESSDTNMGSSPLSSSPSHAPVIHSLASSSPSESCDTSESSLMVGQRTRRRGTEWMDSNMIEEDDDGGGWGREPHNNRSPHHDSNLHLIPVLGFILVASVFCLVLWGISRPIKTRIVVQDFRLNKFKMGTGSDHTGIRTTMLTLNTSLKVRYYQPRKSRRLISVSLGGSDIPLYGAARSFTHYANSGRIPLTLEVHIQSLGKVVWTLVESQQQWNISCPLSIGTSSHQKPVTFSQNSCEYEDR